MTKHESGFALSPTILNLGSGRDFRPDALNIDIDPAWSPDAVLDLSRVVLGPEGQVTTTERFGSLRLMPGGFSHIDAHHVFEQVADLATLMTTCLSLLQVGGTLSITVAYDLSFGAWQDPSNVRAFNERSWLRYTDMFWSMGWDKARFAVDRFNYIPSPLGNELRERDVPRDEIVRTPRAIDSMTVTLRKVALTAGDQAQWTKHRGGRSRGAAPNMTPVAAPPALALARAIPAPVTLAPAAPRAFSDAWSKEKDRYCLWIVSPKDCTQQHAYDAFALGLSEAFTARGGSAPVVTHPSAFAGRLPIVLGPHLLSPNMSLVVPPGSILFNLEPIDLRPEGLKAATLALLKRFAVLDVSVRHTAALVAAGVVQARTLPVGYAPGLRRIAPAAVQDIDVLFDGAPSGRRQAVLDELQAAGVNVVHLADAYGEARDAAIGRAKLVLSMPAGDTPAFEPLRVFDLLANGICVVGEGDPRDPDIAPFADGLALSPYDGLVARCQALLADDSARAALALQGFARISAVRQADHLGALFDVPASTAFAVATAG